MPEDVGPLVPGARVAAPFGSALATGLVTGIAPALQTPLADITSSLREGERGVAGRRGAARLRSLLDLVNAS